MPEASRDSRGSRRRAKRLRESHLRRRRRIPGGVLRPTRRILGVDPGTRCAGWAIVAGTIHEPELIASGEIRFPERMALADRLACLHSGMMSVILEHTPTDAAVEAPFHGVSARSALQLAHARGAVLAALGSAGLPVSEYSPATIKKAVTGNGRAEKQQVELMVSKLVAGERTPGRSDIADAIAAALCHLFGTGTSHALQKAGATRLRR